jgi:uncharacterized alkaline shock family protein YloU
MTKEKEENKGKDTGFSVPMVTDENSYNMGEIKINHSVIGNIATLSALGTSGVLGVGKKGFGSGFASFFSSRKPSTGGVVVGEDEFGNYIIDIWITLQFGCEVGRVASEVQQSIAKHITAMTSTGVSTVNVIIDGVETASNVPPKSPVGGMISKK